MSCASSSVLECVPIYTGHPRLSCLGCTGEWWQQMILAVSREKLVPRSTTIYGNIANPLRVYGLSHLQLACEKNSPVLQSTGRRQKQVQESLSQYLVSFSCSHLAFSSLLVQTQAHSLSL